MKTLAFLAVSLVAAVAYGDMTPAKLRVLADSTVKVETATGTGSGTVVGKDRVLTCAHVVKNSGALLVETLTADGETHIRKATIVKIDEREDLALLAVPGLKLPAIKIAAADAEEFSTVYNVTAPLGHRRTVSVEVLQKTDPEAKNAWRLTGSAYVGSSGGGVMDANGELQCVFRALWSNGQPFAGMSECINRGTVVRFLTLTQ